MPEESEQEYIGALDITDEMRIQFKIDEYYEFMDSYDGDPDKFMKMKLKRNNILNMVDTFLKKYNNKSLIKEFYTHLREAKKKAIHNNKINKYEQYLNEIRVFQEYKGIQEYVADKLAEDILKQSFETGEDIGT